MFCVLCTHRFIYSDWLTNQQNETKRKPAQISICTDEWRMKWSDMKKEREKKVEK